MSEHVEQQPVEELTYEQAFAGLERIVAALESGDLSLEESMAQFERGQALAGRCAQLLDQAELKLSELTPDESGGYREQEFDQENP